MSVSRKKMFLSLQPLLEGVDMCVLSEGEELVLRSRSSPKKAVIRLKTRIGGKSAFGVSYLSAFRRGFLQRPLTFVVKITGKDDLSLYEANVLAAMNDYVLRGKFPNFPLTYKSGLCDGDVCSQVGKFCPRNVDSAVAGKGYRVIVNEYASGGDLKTFLTYRIPEGLVESLFVQGFLAIAAFQLFLGLAHNDTHLKNFLVHEVKPGGFWHYRVYGRDVYVPNLGWQVVLWDPLQYSRVKVIASTRARVAVNKQRANSRPALTSGRYHAWDFYRYCDAFLSVLQTSGQSAVDVRNAAYKLLDDDGESTYREQVFANVTGRKEKEPLYGYTSWGSAPNMFAKLFADDSVFKKYARAKQRPLNDAPYVIEEDARENFGTKALFA
jgi:hypothetical protein